MKAGESLGAGGAFASKDAEDYQPLEVLAETGLESSCVAEVLQRVEAWAGAVWAGWRVALIGRGIPVLSCGVWGAGRQAVALWAGWRVAGSHWLGDT